MSLDREDQKMICGRNNISAIDKYPNSLRILAVDDNPVCLKLLCAVLKKCGYQFTATTEADKAYEILNKNKNSYDLVLTDVKNNMDGFKFAQLIDLEMDIPVIIMSADDGMESVMNGIKHGARNYLLKPVRYEELKIIWQHVARNNHFRQNKKSLDETKKNLSQITLTHQIDNINDRESEVQAQVNKENKRLLPKKQRCSWKKEVHTKFVNAVAQLGLENAVPKKILELMNEPTLSRENVASHLQKYRKNWDKQKEKAKTMNQENTKAIKDLHCSTTLPCNMNQGITGVNYQHRSLQAIVTDTNLNSFGENLRQICSSLKSQDGIPQHNFQYPWMGDQMSRTLMNNPTMSSFAATSHSNPHFGPKQEMDGSRFNSLYSRPTKTKNNYDRGFSYFSGGFNHSGGLVPMGQPTNPLLMAPLLSYSYGPTQAQTTLINQPTNPIRMVSTSSPYGQVQMHDATQLTHMGQPNNFVPMLPPNSSYGQIQISRPDAMHSNQVAQYTNSLPMVPASYSYGQFEREKPFDFKGKEETHSFVFDTIEQSIDSSILDPKLCSDIECVTFDDDHLGAMVSQFNNNSAPSL